MLRALLDSWHGPSSWGATVDADRSWLLSHLGQDHHGDFRGDFPSFLDAVAHDHKAWYNICTAGAKAATARGVEDMVGDAPEP